MSHPGSQCHDGPCYADDPLSATTSRFEHLVRVRDENGVYAAGNGTAYRLNSVAELSAFRQTTMADGQVVEVLGYYTPGDGGGGIFTYDESSVLAGNGGTIIAPDHGRGRWLRGYTGALSVLWFGAKGDGVAGDSAAIQAALTAGPSIVIPFGPTGTYLLDAPLSIPSDRALSLADGVMLLADTDIGGAILENSDVVNGNTNIHISGFATIDGANDQTDAYPAIKFTNVSLSSIRNVTVARPFGGVTALDIGCFELRECSRIGIYDCAASSVTFSGIYSRDSEYITVRGGNYSENAGNSGIDLVNSPFSSVQDVTAIDNSASGISLNSQYCTAVGNRCAGNSWGINIGHNLSYASASYTTVSGNVCVNNSGSGIQVQAGFTVEVNVGDNITFGNGTNYALPAACMANRYNNSNNGDGTLTPGLKRHIVGALGFPVVTGTAQTGVLRLQGDGSNGVLDFSVNGGSGAAMQATSQADLSQVYPLYLNPNGGLVNVGGAEGMTTVGPATFGRIIKLYNNVVNYVSAAAAGAGAVYLATDCTVTTPGTIAAGSGGNKCMVFSNGVNWIIA